MAFTESKKAWNELYTFFRLLSDGYVDMGNYKGEPSGHRWRIAYLQREEEGIHQFTIHEQTITVEGERINEEFPREDFETAANAILEAIRSTSEDEVKSPDGIEEFLDALGIYSIDAPTTDRTDLRIGFWDAESPSIGFVVRSQIGKAQPLLDGGRSANLKFELNGVKLPAPTVNKINGIESPQEVFDRMMMIERMGGVLKYNDVSDKVFRSNLLMIDLHFPRLLSEMLRTMYLDDITRVKELTELMIQLNPLKIKDELIQKHGFYEFKVKQFLMALALGMRPAKIYTGADSLVEGIVWMNAKGKLVCYHQSRKEDFENFLYAHTRFEKASTEKDKYGFIERENGQHYFKLNLKIGFLKR